MEPKRIKDGKQIIINTESLETRVAVLKDGELDNFKIERASKEHIVGSIFKGRVQNLEDGLQAAFVDIGMKKNAFIHYWDMIPEDVARLEAEEGIPTSRRITKKKRWEPGEMEKAVPVGSEIIVQVTKGAIGTKGPRITANISMPGRYLVMLPGCKLKGISRKIEDKKERLRLKKVLKNLEIPENMGLIVRTAGVGADRDSFLRDVKSLMSVWEQIESGIKEKPAPCCLYHEPDLAARTVRDALTEDVKSIVLDEREEYEEVKELVGRLSRRAKNKLKLYTGSKPIFEYYGIESDLQNIFKRKVNLKGGGCLIFDETEALVAVDVNTGKHKGSKTQDEAIRAVNLEAAEEVARQLRLRNVGGLIVIDFIDMRSKRDQNAVMRKLKEGLKHDKASTNVLAISQLGLLEMTRQRVEESVRDVTYMDCPYCSGRGKVKSALSMSVELQRHLAEIVRRNRRREMSLKIIVNPAVLNRLREEDEEQLVLMEKEYHAHLTFVSDHNRHMEEFVIEDAETGDVLYKEA
jgi:ribonuclease G